MKMSFLGQEQGHTVSFQSTALLFPSQIAPPVSSTHPAFLNLWNYSAYLIKVFVSRVFQEK